MGVVVLMCVCFVSKYVLLSTPKHVTGFTMSLVSLGVCVYLFVMFLICSICVLAVMFISKICHRFHDFAFRVVYVVIVGFLLFVRVICCIDLCFKRVTGLTLVLLNVCCVCVVVLRLFVLLCGCVCLVE